MMIFLGNGRIIVCLGLLLLSKLDAVGSPWKVIAEDFRPTRDELKRGIVHQAPPHWGVKIRNTRSFRILCLGGSNTATAVLYVDKLRSLVLNCNHINTSSSYVINEGIAAHGPMRKRYEFEDKLPTSQWPNIVTLEFAVNSLNEWRSAMVLDDFIFFLNNIYSEKALPPPSYLIIELFKISHYYPEKTLHEWQVNNPTEPSLDSSGVNNLDSGLDLDPLNFIFNRGTKGGACIDALARFYGYPLVSLTDAMFPSFLRYYTTYSNATMWPYSRDGLHISPLGGSVLVEHILFPFLLSELEPRDTDPLYQNVTSIYGNVDFRMFPRKTYTGGVVQRWASWGSDINTMLSRTKSEDEPAVSFMSIPGHPDGLHTCFGTSKKDAVLKLRFGIKEELVQTYKAGSPSPFRLEVGFVFSWNESFVGKALCSVFATHPEDHSQKTAQIGSPLLLDFSTYNGHKIHDTTLREVTIPPNVTLPPSSMLLECINLLADRYTCIGSMTVVY